MREETKGYLFGVLAAFFWGTHAVITRYLATSIPGIVIATLRLYIACFVILGFLKITGTKIDWGVKDRKWFLLIVLLGMSLNWAVFHTGLEYTTASSAMLLENTAPVFVLLFLALFLKERIKKIEMLAVLVTFLGVLLVVIGDKGFGFFSEAKFFGDFLEIIAGVTMAIFIIGSSKVFAREKTAKSRLTNMLKIFLVSAVVLSPSLLIFRFALGFEDMMLFLLLGVFPTVFAFGLWYESAARISTVSAALIFNLSIAFTFLNAYLFLGESITIAMATGAVLIVAGITLTKIQRNKLE